MSLHPCQHLLLSVLLITATLVGKKWYLIVVTQHYLNHYLKYRRVLGFGDLGKTLGPLFSES